MLPAPSPGDGWTTLVDGARMTNLDGFSPLGKGNWSLTEGTLRGQRGELGYLVTQASYTDFELRAEFWADADCNSGLFLRCQDRSKVTADSSYEVNILDKRPDPSYGTAAIVNLAKAPLPYPQAANKRSNLRGLGQGRKPRRRLQRPADGRRARRQVQKRPAGAAVGRRHDPLPQGADPRRLSGPDDPFDTRAADAGLG